MNYTVILLEPAYNFIRSLPPKIESKAFRAVSMLKEFGFQLSEPHSKTLVGEDGLKELRVKVGTDICRIFYFHHHDKIYVATSGYTKKTMNSDRNEIAYAQRIRQTFLEENR